MGIRHLKRDLFQYKNWIELISFLFDRFIISVLCIDLLARIITSVLLLFFRII